ncbi:MAG: hypothetical protein AAFW73_18605 [Bacteroidota bacterium]
MLHCPNPSHCTLFLVLLGSSLTAQVRLENASFEGDPQDATTPVSWHPCAIGTTPDILPGPWGVYQEASEGDTYMGLITREDGTHESVGQRLPQALDPNACYSFRVDLAHSPSYSSYSAPLRVRIWGGKSRCERGQLLAESEVIDHQDWESYEFKFTTKIPVNYILLEANFLSVNGEKIQKGNILIDNITQIRPCSRAGL